MRPSTDQFTVFDAQGKEVETRQVLTLDLDDGVATGAHRTRAGRLRAGLFVTRAADQGGAHGQQADTGGQSAIDLHVRGFPFLVRRPSGVVVP